MRIYSRDYFLRKILGCTEVELEIAKEQKKEVCQEFKIPKKNGYRTIVSIDSKSNLAKLQHKLLSGFFSQIPISIAAKGFVKNSSYLDFLEEHTGHEYFLRLDIESFFDSISKELLIENLTPFIAEENIEDIVELCTYNDKVPQGFCTSPAISNIVFRRLDQRIRKYCRAYHKEMKREIYYTRYADDMLFSSVGYNFSENKNFKRMIGNILNENGFRYNESKTIYAKKEISLSGYVIKEDIHLSRSKLYNVNEVIYQFDRRNNLGTDSFNIKENLNIKKIIERLNEKKLMHPNGEDVKFKDVNDLIHYLAGYRSYLIQVGRMEIKNKAQSKRITDKIKKIEMILERLSQIVDENK